ncbi:MAG TPA: DNA mismatch repair protein MutS [Candidatus Dormibacteraeota bacterium]
MTAETPVLKQYREVKDRHPESLVLFRLGDFFELFFEDAERAAPILGVTLTSRPLGRSGRAPMCGVPHHAWRSYVGKLLRAGLSVVICDQLEASTGKGIVRRDVTRVLTPGTVVEDEYLDAGEANWLVAAWEKGREAGLAACDVSTGELLLCQLPRERLQAELERLRPAELLMPPEVELYRFDPERGKHRLRDRLGIAQPASIGATEAPLALGAAGVVVEHLERSQVRLEPGLFRVRTYWPGSAMELDAATVRNLELPAFVKLIDRTATAAGLRQLRAWLSAPLRDVETIGLRLAAVEELSEAGATRSRLRDAIAAAGDLERLLSRAAQGHAGPRGLVALRTALDSLPALQDAAGALESLQLRTLASHLRADGHLAERLRAALVDEPPARAEEGGAIRAGFDPELDRIREASRSAREWIAELESRERERTGIRSLKVGFNRVFGYYIEVGHGYRGDVPADYVRKQTLTGAERYLTPELKERETVVLNAQQDIVAREHEIVRELSDAVAGAAGPLLESARAAAELDALQSLATAARELDWHRPEVDAGGLLEIEAGRHPLVEAALPAGSFVPNDLTLDTGGPQVIVLTGPNMAGKSTYLRQAALIVLLAQCGSFVPAGRARIGVADRIFTRVGAHDDLVAGMSTFMVEMAETANILAHATGASIVVFDEVGRGTSTYDGVSIAQAVVEHIHDRVGCRTLFATHYHELTALADRLPRVENHRVDVLEEGSDVRFLHHVVPGGADRSYGIHVAALAGLPTPVVARARQVLEELERQRPLEPPEQQLGLPLAPAADPLRKELEELQLDHLSPIEALQKLYELRTRAANP